MAVVNNLVNVKIITDNGEFVYSDTSNAYFDAEEDTKGILYVITNMITSGTNSLQTFYQEFNPFKPISMQVTCGNITLTYDLDGFTQLYTTASPNPRDGEDLSDVSFCEKLRFIKTK